MRAPGGDTRGFFVCGGANQEGSKGIDTKNTKQKQVECRSQKVRHTLSLNSQLFLRVLRVLRGSIFALRARVPRAQLRYVDQPVAHAGASENACRCIALTEVAQHRQRAGKILVARVVVDRDDGT